MAQQTIIGKVYSMEGFDYKKNGEDRRRVVFRVGMPLPYKTEKVIDGEKRQVRDNTFVTAKCFNGLSETLEEYFGGEENKGRWIQLQGHYETEEFEVTQEVDHPEDDDIVIELPVKVQKLVFMVSGFSFIGDAPSQSEKPKAKTKEKKGPTFKRKSDKGGATKGKTSAEDAQSELAETEEAPF